MDKLRFTENVETLTSGKPKGPALVFSYLDNCYYSQQKAPEFNAFAKSYSGSLKLYSLNIKKYPLEIDAVPVIIAVNEMSEVQVQDADTSLKTQLKKAEQFALKNK